MPAHTLPSRQDAPQPTSGGQGSPEPAETSAHTPGPWFPVWNGYYWDINVGPEILDHTLGLAWTNKRFALNAKANARLIAAAPDMLAALKVVALNLSLHGKPSEGELNDLHRMATEAIAKAEAAR